MPSGDGRFAFDLDPHVKSPQDGNDVYGERSPGPEIAHTADHSPPRLRLARLDAEHLIKIPGAGCLGKFVSEQVSAHAGVAQLVGDDASRTLGGERRD